MVGSLSLSPRFNGVIGVPEDAETVSNGFSLEDQWHDGTRNR